MPDEASEGATYRRRERSLALGVVVWAITASVTVTFWPEQTADWIISTPMLTRAGVILVSVGLCGGAADALFVAANWWAETDDADLTEWENDVE